MCSQTRGCGGNALTRAWLDRSKEIIFFKKRKKEQPENRSPLESVRREWASNSPVAFSIKTGN